MRAILLILIVAVVALIVAVQTGFVHLQQTQPAVAPGIAAENGKIITRPGQAPRFEVQTGSVGVGKGTVNVGVPAIEIKRQGTAVGVPNVVVNRPGTPAPAAPPAPAVPPAPGAPAKTQ